MRVLSFSGLRDAVAQIEADAGDAVRLYFELERRASENKRDGHRTSSGLERSAPTSEVDDDGTPLPQHSDPTLAAVVQREASDVGCVRFTQAIVKARDAMRRAVELAAEAGVAIDPETGGFKTPEQIAEVPRLPDPGEVWCRWHLEHGFKEPRASGRRGLCSFCDDYDRDRKPLARRLKQVSASSLPPPELLALRARKSSGQLWERDYEEVVAVYRRRDLEAGSR